ncbi:uncharacterized protein HKW66_Vig0148750 [Vigna angularis]|uniref:Uncharacterized protein n=1 Tax=Phaseolus angularis TaxID=3914 RepID=A0A8T0JXK9_PHAAN|nr:uncharacterized protein HKW66_Vig0148750 [Vigna angularis]
MKMLKLEFAAESDMRKKLDGFNVFSNGEAEDVKEADIEKRDLQSLKYKLKYDLRKSLAWDSSFSTSSGIIHSQWKCVQLISLFSYSSSPHSSSGILEPEELFSTSNSFKTENAYDMLRPEQDQHLHFNNLKPEIKTVTDGFSLRKSLAWDSAFFTSEGILNHEELSLLNKGHKKSEMGMLPLIEELRISSESNRTIDNDGSSSASQEISVHQSSNTVDSSTKRMDVDSVPKLKFSSPRGRSDLSSHLKPPKIQSRVRRNAPPAPTKIIPLFANEVKERNKTVKASGKCLTEKPNLLKTCSRCCSCATLSWELSSVISQSDMSASSNGLCSLYKSLPSCHSSPEFSAVKNIPQECCHQSYSYVGKNFCCISPSASIDWFSSASSVTESVGSNTFSEVKGSNYVSFDASRTEKPSGLRMPSPNIGYFDMENLLVPSKERDNKPHSRAVSKIQSGQMLKDARNTRTCSSKTRDANNSLTMKFGRGAVSKDGDVKDYLTKDVKMVNSRAHEHAFERKRCAKVDKRRVGNKILREREEQSCLKSKVFAERTPQANTLYPGNDAFKLHESEKENLVGFENIII